MFVAFTANEEGSAFRVGYKSQDRAGVSGISFTCRIFFGVDKIVVVGFWAPLSSHKQYILLLFGRHRWWLSLLR